MISKKITIKNKSGLHARPAGDFVETAKKYGADIKVSFNEKTKSAKSVIGILTLGIHKDSVIEVIADGPDEKEAIEAIVALAEVNFNEGDES